MANIQSVRFKKAVGGDRILEILNDINTKRFDGLCEVERLGAGFEIRHPQVGRWTYWLMKPRLLEWKHQGAPVTWWACSTFAARMIRAIDPAARIEDEGDTSLMEPSFDTGYPTVADWIMETGGRYMPNILANMMLDRFRKDTPSCLWEDRPA